MSIYNVKYRFARGIDATRTIDARFVAIAGAALLTFVGVYAFSPALGMHPFDHDNLVALTIGRESPFGQLFLGSFIASLPGYRPLPYLSIAAEYHLIGSAPWHFFVVNLVIVIGMGIATFLLTRSLTGSWAFGLAAGAVMLVDPRVNEALFWIGERQSTMAVALVALSLLVARRMERQPTLRLVAACVLLLLAAMLSKEYAMAGPVAVIVMALFTSGRARLYLASSAVISGTLYLFMRFVLAGGASVPYCETEGLWRSVRQVCIGGTGRPDFVLLTGSSKLHQEAWNVLASFIGTSFFSAFSDEGAFRWRTVGYMLHHGPHAEIAFFVCATLLALVAWIFRPRLSLPFLALIVANSVISFLVYRTRNQLMAALGLDLSAAMGAAYLAQVVARRWSARTAVSAAAVVIAGALAWTVWEARQHETSLDARRAAWNAQNAAGICAAASWEGPVRGQAYVSPAVVDSVKRYYRLPNPTCHGGVP